MPDTNRPEFDDVNDEADAAELAELRRFAPAERAAAFSWEKPPPALRSAVLSAALSETSPSNVATDKVTDAPGPAMSPAPVPTAVPTSAPVDELAQRRNTRRTNPFRWDLVAAAAAVLALAVAAFVGLNRPDEQLVASVDLDVLAGSGTGSAKLVDVGGSMQLRLDTSGLDSGDGYLELWVIDPTVSKLVSLGPLRDDGRYDVPASVDMTEYPIVDISVEPPDGDPTHSGNSLLRGQLEI